MDFTPLLESPSSMPVLAIIGGTVLIAGILLVLLANYDKRWVPLMGLFLVVVGVAVSVVSAQQRIATIEETREANDGIIQDNIAEKYQFEADEIEDIEKRSNKADGFNTYNVNIRSEASILTLDIEFDENGEPTIITDGQLTQDDVEELLR